MWAAPAHSPRPAPSSPDTARPAADAAKKPATEEAAPPWAAPAQAVRDTQSVPAADTAPDATYGDFLGGLDDAPAAQETAPDTAAAAAAVTAAAAAPEAPAPSIAGRIGFSGFFQGRLRAHDLGTYPGWLAPDAAGNRLGARLGLQVSGVANAHVSGRAALTFTDDLSGRFLNARSGRTPRRVVIPGVGEGPDTVASDALHHPDGAGHGSGAGVFEDLVGEVEVRSPAVDARVSAGTILWVEGSPLTLWNRDSRPERAWDYEDFEPEMSSAAYHAWKAHSRTSDLGRHAWPRRPLAGLALETVRMPLGLSAKATLADPAAVLPTDVAGRDPQAEGPAGLLHGGNLGSRGALYHLRLARSSRGRELGLSLLAAELPGDLINQRDPSSIPARGFANQFRDGEAPRFANPRVASVEYAGPFGAMALHGELALSLDDTVRYLPVTGSAATFDGRSDVRRARGPPAPAAWLRVRSGGSPSLETEIFYASPGFRSPWSMAHGGLPVKREGMAPSAGASQYRDNLLGVDVRLAPPLPAGFLVFRAGQHVQVEPGPDVVRFEHVLNGRDLWEASSSTARSDAARPLDQGYGPGNPRYDARLGAHGGGLPLYGAQQPGGFRGGDREVWEEFVAFADKAQADSGIAPKNRKWATSLSLDWGIPVDGRLGLARPALVNLLVDIGAVGLDPTALAGPARALLWTGRLAVEPSVSLTDDLHLLGLAGAETWRSRHAWRNTLANKAVAGEYNNRNHYDPLSGLSPMSQGAAARVDAQHAPIDYLQWAVGLGLDWDLAPRTGLHARIKHARHRDAALPGNDWSGTFLFLELKSWI